MTQSLANKYRPKNFIELKSQDFLVRTISNAISMHKISQGYILTGIRGVGKTSAARIIAKTVNCSDKKYIDHIATPCENCTNCINYASHPDIIEFDAASYTSVDDIRQVMQSMYYKPILGQYKVFIIDEVHMLSKSAFNALLKVVEEPPEHVIFIFATTEISKVPVTIISRCQRFDLKHFSQESITSLLEEVCQKEMIKYSKDALRLISYRSGGSARDALSVLSQLSTATTEINESDIIKFLAINNPSDIVDFVISIGDSVEATFKVLDRILESGTSVTLFIDDLMNYLSYLCKLKCGVNYLSTQWDRFSEASLKITSRYEIQKLVQFWQVVIHSAEKIQFLGIGICELLALKLHCFVMLPTTQNEMESVFLQSPPRQ